MQTINCALPSNMNNLSVFDTRRATFQCRGISRLNPATAVASSQSTTYKPITIASSSDTARTRTHLSNLEKLLQKTEPIVQNNPTNTATNSSAAGESRGHTRGNILEGLSLPGIWSAGAKKSAEEMSPRHLNRLQRLLSKSQEYSPRDNLGSRWHDYHGRNDWAGMLDPLDANLRREVIRYGEFVQAAYHAFNSHPATSVDSQSTQDVTLRDKSYKVTKSLYATSSIGLPKWIDEVAPDLGWMTQRSSWIGYVAVCDDKREIARMGRRDIVIALRGTSTCLEWAENLRDVLVPLSGTTNDDNNDNNNNETAQPKVECGFSSLFTTPNGDVPSLANSVVQEIRRLMDLYKGETLSISVTGHSLGAALAVLVGDELSTSVSDVPPVAVYSFGGPRVGNRAFANRINSNNVKVLRIVNAQDVITRVPGMFVSEELDHKLQSTALGGRVLDMIDNTMPWAYTHVGAELRVDTKMSPFLKPNADVACCHDLEAYLHLVDGFMASDSPFRSNAKRSLLKLLSEQGANVKKLYVSKAKSSLMKTKSFDLEGAMNPLMRAPSFNESCAQ